MSDTLTLYTFFSSSCGQRVLTAAALKDIPLVYHPINLATDEHKTAAYKALNPSCRLPLLEVLKPDGTKFLLSQSTAIMDYFEEVFPNSTPLLPPASEPERRAKVRELVAIMTQDCFPPTNSGVSSKVKAIRDSVEDRNRFVQDVNYAGFEAFEKLLEGSAGAYAVGDSITLADVCLVPQIDVSRFYHVDIERFPRTKALYDKLVDIKAFKNSQWTRQPDTPEKYREPRVE